MAALKGHTISHYKILDQIGSGGMGVVYKAHDLTLDRTVALKFLNPVYSCSPDFKSRFLREARAASALDHPNICTVYEVGETEDEQMFLSMAHYEGPTLEERLSAGPLPLQESVSIGVQIAMGLAAAHEKGIVHRDVKTGNIILAPGGRVKIMDFGLAKFPGRSQITTQSVQLGTLAFMSPEQARGAEADHRSDIWALGVMLYQMITGQLPFSSDYDQALIYSILNETPEPPGLLRPEIPKRLEEIILRCLQRNPCNRYQNVSELADDLLKVSGEEPRRTVWRPVSGTGRWVLTGAVGIFVLTLLFVVLRPILRQHQIEWNAVVVEVRGGEENGPGSRDLNSQMVEFLTTDEFLQSTTKDVFNREEFRRLHPGKEPAMDLILSIDNKDVGYQLSASVDFPGQPRSIGDTVFQVHDRSALLTHVLPAIRGRLISGGNLGALKQSTFTRSWDAFVRFYEGYRAWVHLEIPKAVEHLNAALAIDPDFVLAKLRLAEVYQFDERNVQALRLLRSIRPDLGKLSGVDSLRAEALEARINKAYRGEVAIRREIFNMYPLRKESAFDVAEAYYSLCEIPDAITYYEQALGLDPKMARAYNHLSYCYSHQGQHELALSTVKQYVQLDSTANAFDSMGDLYLAAGYLDSAAGAKGEGIVLDPGLNYLYRGLAFTRLRQGRLVDADSAATGYLRHASTPDSRAEGLTFKAFVAYTRKDYPAAMRYCTKALETFDSPDLDTRFADVHWLLSLVSLELGDIRTATAELKEMEVLLQERNVNATNYLMYFYKFYRHLQACLAARRNEVSTVLEVARELDGPLRDKVKDGSSPFDYAYLSTALGELLARPPINRPDLALQRFRLALDYNMRYAPAHYNLWKLYARRGDVEKEKQELKTVKELWKEADPDFRRLLGIPD